jgi:putative hydrolase of the HAD superfamily
VAPYFQGAYRGTASKRTGVQMAPRPLNPRALRPSSPHALKAVLFDAAGTLFRVRGCVGLAYATVAARHGVAASAEEMDGRFHSAFRSMPPMCFPGVPEEDLPEHERAWWRQVVSVALAGFRLDDFETFFSDLFSYFARADSWELYPDVIPVLSGLRARHLRLAIVSNFDGRLIRICEGLGIARFFDTVVMSSQVGCAKPDPLIFAIALERIGVSPAEALHVGDSETLDVQGAEAAGLRALLIDRAADTSPRRRIRDLRELLGLV